MKDDDSPIRVRVGRDSVIVRSVLVLVCGVSTILFTYIDRYIHKFLCKYIPSFIIIQNIRSHVEYSR